MKKNVNNILIKVSRLMIAFLLLFSGTAMNLFAEGATSSTTEEIIQKLEKEKNHQYRNKPSVPNKGLLRNGGGGLIIADDFMITPDQVAEVRGYSVQEAANIAYAYAAVSGANPVELPITSVEGLSGIQTAKGVYPITFKAQMPGYEDLQITIQALVDYNNTNIINQLTNPPEGMVADDILMTVEEAAVMISPEQAKAKAYLNAWQAGRTSTPIQNTSINVNGLAGIKPEKGVYPIEFSTGNGTKFYVQAIVGYSTTPVIDNEENEGIIADDFEIFVEEVAGLTNAKVIDLAKARGWITGSETAPLTLQVDYSAIQAVRGVYDVTFETNSGITFTVKATVKDRGPQLTITSDYVFLDVNAPKPNIMDGVTATDSVEGDITNRITADKTADDIDTSIEGNKVVVTYTVSNTVGATATGTRTYLVGWTNPGPVEPGVDRYTIFAKDFDILKSNVDVANANTQLLTLSEAKGIKLANGDIPESQVSVEVANMNGYTNVVGSYNVEYKIVGQPVSTTKVANVTAGQAPVLTVNPEVVKVAVNDTVNVMTGVSATDAEDGNLTDKITADKTTIDTSKDGTSQLVTYSVTDKEGTTTVGYRTYLVGNWTEPDAAGYTIFANDFSIRLSEVTGTNEELIAKSGATAMKVSTTTEPSVQVNVKVSNNGGYMKAVGVYDVTYAVDEIGATATVTKKADVSNGQLPTITVTPLSVFLSKDAASPNVLSGVVANDPEDGIITSSVTADKTTIDTSVSGDVITVTYSVTDSDGNTVTATRTYLIDWRNAGEYAIYANDFDKRISEVTGTDAELVTASSAKAVKLATATTPAETLNVLIVNNGGYKATIGSYTVTYGIDAPDAAVTITKKANVISGQAPTMVINPAVVKVAVNEVVDLMNGVTATDLEEGDLTNKVKTNPTTIDTTVGGTSFTVEYTVVDSDGNPATGKRTYLVGDGWVEPTIDGYTIYAENFNILLSNVAKTGVEAQLISYSKAKAVHIVDGVATPVAVRVASIGGYTKEIGTYPIVYAVGVDGVDVSTTKDAIVDGGTLPVLNIEPTIVHLQVGEKSPVVLAGVTASDVEDGDLTAKVTSTHESIDTSVKGQVVVTYTVVDTDNNSVSGTRTYIVGGVISPDQKTVIFADDFRIDASEVKADLVEKETQIIAKSGARVEEIGKPGVTVDGVKVVSGAVEYTNVKGVYPITLEASTNVALQAKISAIVDYANPPVINVEKKEKIVADDFKLTKDEAAVILTAGDAIARAAAYAWNTETLASVAITSVEGRADIKAERGVYPVTFKTAAGTAITVQAVVDYEDVPTINENNQEGIIGRDFGISLQEAQNGLSFQTALAKSSGRAWKLSTGENVEITTIDGLTQFNGTVRVGAVLPIVLKTAAGTQYTVMAYVGNAVPYHGIAAENFTLSIAKTKVLLADTPEVQLQKVVALSSAKTWVMSTGEPVNFTSADLSEVKAEYGFYKIKLTSENGGEYFVYIVVGYKNIPPLPNPNPTLLRTTEKKVAANNAVATFLIADAFSLTLEEAANPVSGEIAVARSGAGYITAEGDLIQTADGFVITGLENIKPIKGVYPVTFAAEPLAITVQAMVGYSQVDEVPDGRQGIIADNAYFTVDEVNSGIINDQLLIERSYVHGWTVGATESPIVPIGTVIGAAGIMPEKGVYPISFITETGAKKTVQAIVGYDEKPITSLENEEEIIASNFTISLQKAQTLTEQDAINLASAAAWTIGAESEAVPVAAVDIQTLNGITQPGQYQQTFATELGTEIVVTVTVTDGLPIITVDPEEVTLQVGASAPDVLAGVSAVDESGKTIAVTADVTTIDTSVAGDVTVTYTAVDDYGVAAQAKTRIYHITSLPAPNYELVAQNFVMTVSELEAMMNENKKDLIIVEKSQAHVLNCETNAVVDADFSVQLDVNTENLTLGDYDVVVSATPIISNPLNARNVQNLQSLVGTRAMTRATPIQTNVVMTVVGETGTVTPETLASGLGNQTTSSGQTLSKTGESIIEYIFMGIIIISLATLFLITGKRYRNR